MKRTPAGAAWILLLAAAACLAPRPAASAAEIRLQAESRPQGAIVTLGDLADLRCESSDQAARLASIGLLPAPPPGVERFISAREIQDMLLLRGIDLGNHPFSGPATVRVRGSHSSAKPAIAPGAAPAAAKKRLEEAIREHLGDPAEPWRIDVELDKAALGQIAAADAVTLHGKGEPAEGRQRFKAILAVGGAEKALDVTADIGLPPLAVVPVRPLPRAARISAADVEVQRASWADSPAALVERVEDVVGKETNRALTPGKPIERAWIQAPLLVRRGDVVTVYVRAAGIRVRTQARARDDGALGELVMVESPSDRKSYLAHVSGTREVEVLATGVAARASGAKSPHPEEEE